MAETPISTRVRKENGEIVGHDIIMYHTDFISDISARFTQFDIPFRYHRCITDGFIGNAPAQLCSARKMKETIELIYKNSCGKDPLQYEYSIPQKWYCQK
jgi:hypothetical protein